MSTNINVKITNEEKDAVEKLANYLHTLGKIEKPTLSEAVRSCIHYTIGDILKGIEADRYAR